MDDVIGDHEQSGTGWHYIPSQHVIMGMAHGISKPGPALQQGRLVAELCRKLAGRDSLGPAYCATDSKIGQLVSSELGAEEFVPSKCVVIGHRAARLSGNGLEKHLTRSTLND